MFEILTVIKSLTPKEVEFVMGLIKSEGAKTGMEVIELIKKCSREQCVLKRRDLVNSEAESIDFSEKDSSASMVSNERDIAGIEFTKIFAKQNHGTSLTCQECFRLSKNSRGKSGQIAVDVGEVIALVTKKGRSPGSEMCQLIVSDNTGTLRLACFPDKYGKYKEDISEGQKYIIKVKGTGSGWCLEDIRILK